MTVIEQTENREMPDLQGAKILFLLPHFALGGAERQAFLLARELRNRCRASVEIWGPGDAGQISELCDRDNLPWKSYSLQLLRKRNILRFAGLLRTAQPTVLMPYLQYINSITGLVWRYTGAKLCIWNQRNEGTGTEAFGKMARLALPWVPLFISNSPRGADYLIQAMKVNPAKVHVIPNGVDAAPPLQDRAGWRAQLGVSEEVMLACMVATISHYKDHATLLRAWRIVNDALASRGQQAQLLLAGRLEDTYEEAKALSAELGLNAAVRFLGRVDDVSGLLRTVDMGVFSSRSEGLPNGVLEPMAAGLAVAGTDIPGLRVALGVESTDFLAPPGDAPALAERILRLALDPELRAQLGQKNFERAQREFSLEQLCRRTSRLIAEGLAGRG